MRNSLLGLALMGAVGTAAAGPVTFTATGVNTYASGGSTALAASAKFEVLSGNLVVTLTNTSLLNCFVPSDVLTAVFFNIPNVGALTPVSALLNGSIVYKNGAALASQPAGGIVGGEWGYGSGIASATLGNRVGGYEGISSSGLGGLFGSANFPGPNLENPAALDGLQYGILSSGHAPSAGNTGVKSNSLVKDHVVFTLSGIPANFDPSASGAITDIAFQYGTAMNEGTLRPPAPLAVVPLPTSGLMGLAGLGLVGASRLRRRAR